MSSQTLSVTMEEFKCASKCMGCCEIHKLRDDHGHFSNSGVTVNQIALAGHSRLTTNLMSDDYYFHHQTRKGPHGITYFSQNHFSSQDPQMFTQQDQKVYSAQEEENNNWFHFHRTPRTENHPPAASEDKGHLHKRDQCRGYNSPPNVCTLKEQFKVDKYDTELQEVPEDLEPPLPLRSDGGFALQNYDQQPMVSRYYQSVGYEPSSACVCGHSPRLCPHTAGSHGERLYPGPQTWLMDDGQRRANISVNVPRFTSPPPAAVEGVSQISVMPPCSPTELPGERGLRRPRNLPDECRNIFVTYSMDTASEMAPFAEFLSKRGFHPAIDIFDNPIQCMDITKWMDSFLKNPSVIIIIAISAKYKEEIERSGEERHGLHSKYIYSMMQNEFIQQGSLNFRFVPVLFLGAAHRDVPSWLQNTRVYRWPQDAEDILLRLLRVERYIAPPFSAEPTLIIQPVFPNPTNP